MRRLPVLLLLAACTPDGGLKVYNNPPEVTFTAPADGTTVAAGAWVTFEAQIKDYQDELADLELVWRSSDGSTPEGTLSYVEGGVVYVVEGFPAGDPTITLQAIDTMGDAGEDTVTLHIVPNEPPSATFTAPLEAAVVLAEDPVRIELVVADPDEVDRTDLSLTWGGAAADVGAPTSADSAGEVTFYLSDLAPGTTQVSVTVTDSLGATANEIVSFEVVLADADGDGHRDPAWGGDDCDDADATVYPDADEACDGIDHDCDGAVDEDDALDAATWYADVDADGFGDPGSWATACAQPDGYVDDATDCDDARAAAHPGATETCDGTDEDCDGAVDNDPTDAITGYADTDGDGYGDASASTVGCSLPEGYVTDAQDCDDASVSLHPYDADGDGTAEGCGWITVEAGDLHTCAIDSDGTPMCWGDDTYGQATAPATSLTGISAGDDFSCGVDSSGAMSCWGWTGYSLGVARTGAYTSVSAGTYLGAAIDTAGDLIVWGISGTLGTTYTGPWLEAEAGEYGACALATSGALTCYTDLRTTCYAPDVYTALSVGDAHACMLDAAGTPECCGSDNYGRASPPAGPFVAVAAGGRHSCGLDAAGIVECWGDDTYGQGTPPSDTFVAISAGGLHTCGVTEAGALLCWGDDTYGQSTVP